MDDEAAARLRPRVRWWRWLAAIVVIGAGLFVAMWLLDAAREKKRRDRLRAVVPELEAAIAAYAECLLPPAGQAGTPWVYQEWAAGEDLGALADRCAVDLDRLAESLRARVDAGDGGPLYDLEREAGRPYHGDSVELVVELCAQLAAVRATADEVRRRAGLAPGPAAPCDPTIAELDPPYLDRDGFDDVLDLMELDDSWVLADGGTLYLGGRDDDDHRIARTENGESWERVALAGEVERMRWHAGGPWAVARTRPKGPLGVSFHRGGVWTPRVVLPRITDIAAMRPTDGGRVLVGWRDDDAMVVIRLDADATKIVAITELGVTTTKIPALALTSAGDVTAIWKTEDGDADVIHLAAGAKHPRRTTEKATGAVFDLCVDGRDVFLRFGSRLLHSADGGATLTEMELGSLEWHHLACGPGWLAGLDATGASYVLCRAGTCRRSDLTRRDFHRFALARHGAGARVLAQTYGVAVLWDDPSASGTLRLHSLHRVDDQHTLVQIADTWFHTSAADLGAY